MTYNLQDFKHWLNSDPSRKRNLPLWEDYFQLIVTFEGTITELAFSLNLVGRGEIAKQKVQKQYRAVLREWKKSCPAERERERERERRSITNASVVGDQREQN